MDMHQYVHLDADDRLCAEANPTSDEVRLTVSDADGSPMLYLFLSREQAASLASEMHAVRDTPPVVLTA